MGFFKNSFLAAADRLHLTSEESTVRQAHRAIRPVGEACKKYLRQAGTGEFYGRLNEALLAEGWPADPLTTKYFKKPKLDDSLSAIVWELSITSMDHTGTFFIRDTLENRLKRGNSETREKARFVLSHLDDVTKALKSVTEELDREIAQPGGILLRHCTAKGFRSVFDKKNTP